MITNIVDMIGDRGHLVPFGDLLYSKNANKTTFLFVNCVPQKPKMNRGEWRLLESYVRNLSLSSDSCVIYTGIDNKISDSYIGDKVYIPASMFKLVYRYEGIDIDTILWIMPNKNRLYKYGNYKISYT